MSRPALITMALVLILLVTPGAAASQEVSPVASPTAGLIVPDPSECNVEPRPLSFFEDLIANPPSLPPDADQRFWPPEQERREWVMPKGEPADDETVAEITAALHMTLACLNGNDFLRFLAMFSDDMVRLFFALDPLPPEALPSLAATPVASPPEQTLGYINIHHVRVLPDGRVAALAYGVDPTQPPFGLGTDFVILVKVGDRWLIDSLIENVVIVEDATPEAGTPAASITK